MCSFTLFKFELFEFVYEYEYSDKHVIQLTTNANKIFGTAIIIIVISIYVNFISHSNYHFLHY